ncbi:MAG: hypothetical protein MRECE_30c003 [Mycoplasmataceae bacterium CE_OT135]|nr:MAG: hypothetical protein MRECE_30c003 [Mycoplasmataceae bacterium CE_OT135]
MILVRSIVFADLHQPYLPSVKLPKNLYRKSPKLLSLCHETIFI